MWVVLLSMPYQANPTKRDVSPNGDREGNGGVVLWDLTAHCALTTLDQGEDVQATVRVTVHSGRTAVPVYERVGFE